MAIYRGDGGAGDATNDITINQITELSSNAQAAATSASSSATAASTSAGAASTSATNAANSATAASTSETNAASSASSASTSANNASTSETNAAASETNAAASEAAAALSETAAAASESAAATSATNASASETNAASSASAAATSETNAATSASGASTSASNAATSASNAATSETNAATSETNAAASATAAAASAASAASSDYATSSWYATTNNASNWDTAYGWGDHASAGYVVSTGDTMTGDLSFGDNNKAIFGAGSDLKIYHDGSNSYVQDVGTGNLMLRGTNVQLRGNTTNELFMNCVENGRIDLYYDNAVKLATTNTGIDVTGTVTSDGLDISDANPIINFTDTTNNFDAYISAENGNLELNSDSNNESGSASTMSFKVDNTERMRIDSSGNLTATGDVTAYSDERLKENWKDLPEGFVESLAGVKSGTYNRIDLDGKQQVGVSAQSLQTVLPDAVIESNDTLTVNYGNAALSSAIELAKKVVELEARIKELEGK